MSVEEISGAQACGELSCPWVNGSSTPANCSIPYDGSPSDYCRSVEIGRISEIVIVIAFVTYMLGVGAAMELEKARHALKHPRPPVVGLFCQVVLNPLLMFALIAIFGTDFPVSTRIMAILIASAPGGSGSNLLCLLAYGSVELSVVMTIFSTLCAFATMPFFVFLGTKVIWKEESADLSVDFLAIFLSACAATFLPLLGLLIKKKVSERLGYILSTYGTVIGIAGTIATALLYLADPLFRDGLRLLGWQVWLCAFFLNAGGLTVGYLASRLNKFPRRFHRTIAFEVGSQNVTIPLAVITITFSAGPVASLFTPFLGAYLIGSIPVNYGMMLVWRYAYPIHEPHHDGYDEEEEKEDEEQGQVENSPKLSQL